MSRRRCTPIACFQCGAVYAPWNGTQQFCSFRCRSAAKTRPLKDRLLEKIAVNSVTGCWEFTGYRDPNGYGRIQVKRGRDRLAHRMSWTVLRGAIPEGLDVLHRCDNPPCVNPDHLFLGTAADNHADMIAKGRGRSNPRRGIENNKAKLTEAEVIAIRDLASSGKSTYAIAEMFGVTRPNIGYIVNGKTWRHLQ